MSEDATPNSQPYATQVSSSASPLMFGADLANDLLKSITIALEAKAVFREGSEPLEIFRDAVANAITNIDERASLLRRFLRHGPYEREGDIPPELQGLRLTKQEVSKAITFIYSHAVNCFQGQLTELLAVGPFVQLTEELKASGRLPSHSRTYVGDSVLFSEGLARHRRKAADIHIVSTHDPKIQPHFSAQNRSFLTVPFTLDNHKPSDWPEWMRRFKDY